MKAIVFDMDGVLFDTERVCDEAWRQTAEEIGFSAIETAITDCRGLNQKDTQAYFAAHFPEISYPEFRKRSHTIMAEKLSSGIPVKTGAYELLDWLQQQEWRIALATSTSRESTMHHLESANMTKYFSAIITGEQVENGKPDPEIYETACDAIGSTPALTFAVEDSPNGVRSAAAAKLRVLMVPDLVKCNMELRELVVTVQKDLFCVKQFLEKYGDA